jgi:hypothetical protein
VITDTADITASQFEVARANGVYFGGSVDDVRLYRSAFSADDVKRLYGLGATTHIAASPQTGLAASTQASGASNGLVGWWTFDGANLLQNATDSSGQGNMGYLSGFTSTTTLAGPVGQALSFNSTATINAGSATSLDDIENQGGGGMSGAAWIKTESSDAAAHTIFMKGSANVGAGEGDWAFRLSTTNKLEFVKGADTTVLTVMASNAFPTKSWHHVAFTWDGSLTATNVHIYVDGVEVSYGTQTNGASAKVSDSSLSVAIGGSVNRFLGEVGGKIDDVRLYNRVLSMGEVKRLYEIGATAKVSATPQTGLAAPTQASGASNGLVGWWTFDGSKLLHNATDSSGQGNTGFLQGFTATSSAVAFGKLGQALSFNGTSAYVSEPTTISNIRTISFWARASTTAAMAQGLVNLTGSSIYISTNASRAISLAGAEGTFYVNGVQTGSPTLSGSAWHHVVVTSAGDITGSQIEFGRANSVLFGGSLDEVRVYNRVLSAAEVLRIYQTGQ